MSPALHPVVAWLVGLMLQFAPPDRSPQIPTWDETAEQRRARYVEIAHDIHAVVYAESTQPLPGLDREQTAAMVLATAIAETGLAPDADLGPCYRGPGYASRCDSGRSVGIMQIMVPASERAAYFADRRRLIAEGLRRMRVSLRTCWRSEPHHRLAAYCSGSCERGRRNAARRWGLGLRMLARPRPLEGDEP